MYVSQVLCKILDIFVNYFQDHDELVRSKEDIEKQLQEQKLALEEQKKRYEEIEVGALIMY